MKKTIFAIIGSASPNSSNERLVDHFAQMTQEDFEWKIFNDLKTLPHFDPALTIDHPPAVIVEFREAIRKADGVLICTPEYIFSIPSGLKNAIEWCVSTTIFSDKPMGLVTASSSGLKGHEELQLIMKTVMAKFTDDTTLLIHGIRGKIDSNGEVTDSKTKDAMKRFISAFTSLVQGTDKDLK